MSIKNASGIKIKAFVLLLIKTKSTKMKSQIKTVLGIVILTSVLFTQSCKKDDDKQTCTGGAGGNLTIVAFPQHHGADVRPYAAYVKYNTQNFPGADAWLYDKTYEADTTENHIELDSLKCGNYYIYMIGFDTALNDTVVGGIPFSTEQTSGEVNVNVAVTE